jgi:hypothetical protein
MIQVGDKYSEGAGSQPFEVLAIIDNLVATGWVRANSLNTQVVWYLLSDLESLIKDNYLKNKEL